MVSITKENNGKAARRRRQRLALVALFASVVGLVFLVHSRTDAPRSRRSVRASINDDLMPPDNLTEAQILDGIVKGDLILVDLLLHRMQETEEGVYEGAIGEFCAIDWTSHKVDPNLTPMYRDVIAQSCHKRHAIDLKKALQAVDERAEHLLTLTGVVFHESRCGSTLAANYLQVAQPEQHRVYSESGPPIAALRACDMTRCSDATAQALLQDTVRLMSVSNDPREHKLFFKIQSLGTRSLPLWQAAFPEIPWTFIYRDPVQVLMSQLKQGPARANCARFQRSPTQPAVLHELVGGRGTRFLQSLSPTEYCAVHLASLTTTAVQSLNDVGYVVNYSNIKERLPVIMEQVWGIPLDDAARDRLSAVSGQYSKGRGQQATTFQEDSQEKETLATPAMRHAAEEYLQDSYDRLEAASDEAWDRLQSGGGEETQQVE